MTLFVFVNPDAQSMMQGLGGLVVRLNATSRATSTGGFFDSRLNLALAHSNIPMPATKRKQKSEVSIIGAGRLGTTLALALDRKGYLIRSLVARRRQSARRAADLLNKDVQVLAAKQLASLRPADVVLITTPDDQIAGVAEELSHVALPKAVVLHTSGALSVEVLAPLRKKGWQTGSIHPLLSISDTGENDAGLRGAFWSVEGDKAAVRLAKSIVADLDGKDF